MEPCYQEQSIHAMLALLCYFRSEITRQQFLSRFFAQEAPEEMLPLADMGRYSHIKPLCSAYQNKEVSDAEFDEQLLISFRRRPTEDVFSPAVESWDEIKRLISKFEKKRHLPPYLDHFGWIGYLKGIFTRQQYVEIGCSEGDYLCQLLAFRTDFVKDELNEKYSMEVSVALRLRKLCIAYKHESLPPDDFDTQFLLLAKEFCSDIP